MGHAGQAEAVVVVVVVVMVVVLAVTFSSNTKAFSFLFFFSLLLIEQLSFSYLDSHSPVEGIEAFLSLWPHREGDGERSNQRGGVTCNSACNPRQKTIHIRQVEETISPDAE